jgi:hypothetical protein
MLLKDIIATDSEPVGPDPIGGWSDIPDGIWRPIVIRSPKPPTRKVWFDAVTLRDARELARWWNANMASGTFSYERRGKLWAVIREL